MVKSVYIHIPFCKHICSYCDFCKLYYNKKWTSDYLNALEKEIKTKYNGENIETIYIGGGTPSNLDIDELKKLFSIVNIFETKLKEFTFECNVEDINENLLNFLKTTKVNRISIGVQSFNKKHLNYLGRINDIDILEKINLIKKYYKNINIDLIYAFKNETLEDLNNDLETILQLDIPHISTYSLIIEENTMLRKEKPIDEELDYKMYKLINEKLKNYNHYEVSNFSKKGYESKHNLIYWNNEEYYGFGLGASGYLNNIRYENTRNIKEYINNRYLFEEHKLSILEQMQNEMILGLRKLEGVNKQKFKERYQKEIKQVFDIEILLKEKKLIETDEYIFINKDYIYLSNEILINFI